MRKLQVGVVVASLLAAPPVLAAPMSTGLQWEPAPQASSSLAEAMAVAETSQPLLSQASLPVADSRASSAAATALTGIEAKPELLSQAGAAATSAKPPSRKDLLIPPLIKREKPWPSPSLSPGVPSAFVANWGDVFVGVSGATAGKARSDVDASFNAGVGLGDSAKTVGIELSGGCGSFKKFCTNGSFTARIGRLLVQSPDAQLAIAASWANWAYWSNEGPLDQIYYGVVSYGIPLRGSQAAFPQTLQISAGIGNSSYAPASAVNSQSAIGGFGSIGVQLLPSVGISAGWSGRGANAQLSYTPFREQPITLNLLGADLFNQTPSGAVAVFSISWGRNFTTPTF